MKPPAKEEEKEEDSNGEDDLRGVRRATGGRGGNGGGSAAETKATDTADTARSTLDAASELVRGGRFGGDDDHPRTSAREGNGGAPDFNGASDPGCRSDA